MIRTSEAVLPGHPDKFCDLVTDAIVAECYAVDPVAYCQVEMSVWSDQVFLTGGTATREPLRRPLEEIVKEVGRDIGYVASNCIVADRYTVHDHVCKQTRDPREWTTHVNDQCIAIGWAGYDEKVHWLPPEHFLVHHLTDAIWQSCRSGRLKGQGPDGKLLVRVRENADDWRIEHILITLQQQPEISLMQLTGLVLTELEDAYARLKKRDRRWQAKWQEIRVLVNPNGPLINGGSDGDNGQTGRKLVMDYYGPRVPIGGGALSGKDLSHIDRAAAYAAREAALTAVVTGALTCKVVLSYAPNLDEPLDVIYEMEGRGKRLPTSWFAHPEVVGRYRTRHEHLGNAWSDSPNGKCRLALPSTGAPLLAIQHCSACPVR